MALAPTTGNPPAVTHDQIEAWNKIADDVAAALAMGGQQGLDFLLNIMSEWCEAVDDVNAARQICIDLAERGLRHEAINWHAKGFFEVADRIDPDRPGWEAWEAALHDRDVVTPRIDAELKEMANRIHEDLETRDLSGQSLGDYLTQLRKNMLLRGHLGERLVILESIRGLDPAGLAWQDMISPIRRRRVDMIADEVKAAIARRDYDALATLREEVASQDWGDDLPGTVPAVLDAVSHCESLGELRGQLSRTAATLVGRFEEARGQPMGSQGQMAALQAAAAARQQYAATRGEIVQAVRAAQAVPEVAAIVAEMGVKDALRQLDAAIREPSAWLDQQAEAERIRRLAGDIEASVLRHIDTAPRMTGSRESFQIEFGKWKRQADEALEQARKAAARLPGGPPASTEAVFQRLGASRGQLEEHLARLKKRETALMFAVLGGIGLVVLLLVVVVIVAMILR